MSALPRREDGLIAVPVAQGPVNLDVDWTTSTATVAGRALSVLALLLITALSLFERKFAPRRLK